MAKRAEVPFFHGYVPELDVSPVLRRAEITYYKPFINVVRWVINIRCNDINTEISFQLSHIAMPREGNLEATLNIMRYLNLTHDSHLAYDPTYADIYQSDFKECN